MIRNNNLDILRGVAVLLVLFRHMTLETHDNSLINLVFLGMRRIGWIGVDIFFVLSGYLVTRLLWREQSSLGKANVLRFLKRRSLKIFPLFYLLILGSVVLNTQHRQIDYKNLLVELVFVQSYFDGLWTHTWSLSVEEHFYLLIATMFAVATLSGTRNPHKLLLPLVTTAVLSFGLRSYVSLTNMDYSFHTHISASYLRFDGLALGAITAITTWQKNELASQTTLRLKWLTFISTAVFAPYLLLHSQETSIVVRTVGFLLVAVLTSILIVTITLCQVRNQKKNRTLLTTLVARIGVDSYATYLLHLPLFEAINSLNLDRFSPNWLVGALSMAMAILAGRLISHLVDLPLLRFRDRICP